MSILTTENREDIDKEKYFTKLSGRDIPIARQGDIITYPQADSNQKRNVYVYNGGVLCMIDENGDYRAGPMSDGALAALQNAGYDKDFFWIHNNSDVADRLDKNFNSRNSTIKTVGVDIEQAFSLKERFAEVVPEELLSIGKLKKVSDVVGNEGMQYKQQYDGKNRLDNPDMPHEYIGEVCYMVIIGDYVIEFDFKDKTIFDVCDKDIDSHNIPHSEKRIFMETGLRVPSQYQKVIRYLLLSVTDRMKQTGSKMGDPRDLKKISQFLDAYDANKKYNN